MTLAQSTGKFSHKPCVAFEGLSGAETLPAGLLLTWWNGQRGEKSQGQVKPEARKREEQSSSVFFFLLCRLLLERSVLVIWGFYQRLFSVSKLHTAGAIA